MFDFHEDGTRIIEVPIPESIKETGTIPEEYAVGEFSYLFCFLCFITTIAIARLSLGPIYSHRYLGQKWHDNHGVSITSMASDIFFTNSLYGFRQIPDDLFVKIKEEINAAVNVTIAPWIAVEKVSRIISIFFFVY